MDRRKWTLCLSKRSTPASASSAGSFGWEATACLCCNTWKIFRPISPPQHHAFAKRRGFAVLIQSCVGPMVLPVNQIAATASLLLGWTNGLTEWILWLICNCGFLPFFLRDRDFARGFRSRCFHVLSPIYRYIGSYPALLQLFTALSVCQCSATWHSACLGMYVDLKPPRRRCLPGKHLSIYPARLG